VSWLTGFMPVLFLLIVSASAALAQPATISGPAKIVDGDTLDVGAVRIRLHGIDAPEAGQSCKLPNGKTWSCGTAAMNELAELVDGRTVECQAHDRDAYGRIIASCSAAGVDLNRHMVEKGLAWAFLTYSDAFAELEGEIRAAAIGIWQAPSETPWDYRANRWARAAEASPRPGCPIKGNVARGGERIYHTPWSPWYGRTQINEAAGERAGSAMKPRRWKQAGVRRIGANL